MSLQSVVRSRCESRTCVWSQEFKAFVPICGSRAENKFNAVGKSLVRDELLGNDKSIRLYEVEIFEYDNTEKAAFRCCLHYGTPWVLLFRKRSAR